jgi:hypothetical protein
MEEFNFVNIFPTYILPSFHIKYSYIVIPYSPLNGEKSGKWTS